MCVITNAIVTELWWPMSRGEGVLPYMGHISMCRGIGYSFEDLGPLNRVSFFTFFAVFLVRSLDRVAKLYYTSYSLWKIWLVESIQSFHNSLWTWHNKCNIRYYIYHVKFNVCLVTKPLGVFSSETKWLNASLLFSEDELCEKCIIKQLLKLNRVSFCEKCKQDWWKFWKRFRGRFVFQSRVSTKTVVKRVISFRFLSP